MSIEWEKHTIDTRSSYYAPYKNVDGSLNEKKIEAAFAEASSNRKFEIERYWDRAKYFWRSSQLFTPHTSQF